VIRPFVLALAPAIPEERDHLATPGPRRHRVPRRARGAGGERRAVRSIGDRPLDELR
jgi:hypothetical protein